MRTDDAPLYDDDDDYYYYYGYCCTVHERGLLLKKKAFREDCHPHFEEDLTFEACSTMPVCQSLNICVI